jgi:hypothetical protein
VTIQDALVIVLIASLVVLWNEARVWRRRAAEWERIANGFKDNAFRAMDMLNEHDRRRAIK